MEKNSGEKVEFNPTKNSRSGARKLVGIDLESLKKRVEADPLIEDIKSKITKNKLSTEWRLFLPIKDIQETESQTHLQAIEHLRELKTQEVSQNSAINEATSGMKGETVSKAFDLYREKQTQEEHRTVAKTLGGSQSQPTLLNQRHLRGTESSFGIAAAS